MIIFLGTKVDNILMIEVYNRCKEQELLPMDQMSNQVKALYELYTDDQMTEEISVLVTPDDIHSKIEVIYQNIPNLHMACPNNKGDWYFSGDYPTPGGMRVVNRAFINYMDGNDERAY